MDLPLHDLPDDVDALKAMVLAMAREQAEKEARLKAAEAEIARLEAVEKSANERIANLTSIMKVLQRTQHGRRSERLRLGVSDEQVSFAFEEVETGLSAIQSELDDAARDKPKRASRPRKGFAAHLERIEEVIEPEIPAGFRHSRLHILSRVVCRQSACSPISPSPSTPMAFHFTVRKQSICVMGSRSAGV